MEKQSLAYLFSELSRTMQNAEVIKVKRDQETNPIQKAHSTKTLKFHEARAKYYADKIDNFGSGLPFVQVTGLKEITGAPTEGGSVFSWKEKFVYYLYGVKEQEARLIMKAQAIKNNLIEETLEFRTIEFRNYITI